MEEDCLGSKIISKHSMGDREDVARIKSYAVGLVNMIDKIDGCQRRKSIAITNIETAVMFAVKSMTTK